MSKDENDLNNSSEEPEFRDLQADFHEDFEDDPRSSGIAGSISTNRTLLQILVAVVAIAIGFAVWILTNNGENTSASNASPTPVVVPTSTPTPTYQEPTPTPQPTAIPTPLPQGFRNCDTGQLPAVGVNYVVDTNTTPLKQRRRPSIQAEQAGSYPPATKNLQFTGECVVNEGDGLVWWSINNGEEVVWIAAKFVSQS